MCGSPDSGLEQALSALRRAMDAEPLSERVLDLTAQLAAALEAQKAANESQSPRPPAADPSSLAQG